jgi:hypothetical protein
MLATMYIKPGERLQALVYFRYNNVQVKLSLPPDLDRN